MTRYTTENTQGLSAEMVAHLNALMDSRPDLMELEEDCHAASEWAWKATDAGTRTRPDLLEPQRWDLDTGNYGADEHGLVGTREEVLADVIAHHEEYVVECRDGVDGNKPRGLTDDGLPAGWSLTKVIEEKE